MVRHMFSSVSPKTLIALIWYRISYSQLNYHLARLGSVVAFPRKEISYSHLFVYPKELCTQFHLFCRVNTTNPYCTHVTYPHFPGLSPMQCGDGIVELSVQHARMILANLINRRQQLDKSTEHKISMTCIIISAYCIYIWLSLSW